VVRTTRVRPRTRPAAADGVGTGRFAAGHHGTRTRRRRECITRRPRRTIGQLCCSDSPDDGCSLSHHGGAETAKRPNRQVGLRYSAGRAPGGWVGSSLVFTGRGSSAQERERGTGGLQADGPEASTRVRPTIIKPRHRRGPLTVGRKNKTNKQQHTQSGRKFAHRGKRISLKSREESSGGLWVRGMGTVYRVVHRGVGRVVHRGPGKRTTHQASRNFVMRASTSVLGRPNRKRLVPISRWALCRRGRGASARSRRSGEVGAPRRSSLAQAVKL
jgi:hypothetical protein